MVSFAAKTLSNRSENSLKAMASLGPILGHVSNLLINAVLTQHYSFHTFPATQTWLSGKHLLFRSEDSVSQLVLAFQLHTDLTYST